MAAQDIEQKWTQCYWAVNDYRVLLIQPRVAHINSEDGAPDVTMAAVVDFKCQTDEAGGRCLLVLVPGCQKWCELDPRMWSDSRARWGTHVPTRLFQEHALRQGWYVPGAWPKKFKCGNTSIEVHQGDAMDQQGHIVQPRPFGTPSKKKLNSYLYDFFFGFQKMCVFGVILCVGLPTQPVHSESVFKMHACVASGFSMPLYMSQD